MTTHNDDLMSHTTAKIAFCKRILAAVDDYHERPTRHTRTDLRALLMNEFDELILKSSPLAEPAQAAMTEGMVLLPMVPTHEMCVAATDVELTDWVQGEDGRPSNIMECSAHDIWKAMAAAAPNAPA